MTVQVSLRGFGDPRELAARMRQRITLQTPQESDDGAGGVTRSWSDVDTVWAEVLPLSGGRIERLFARQLQDEVSHRIIIRYRDDVTATMRVVYAGRAMNIRSVVNVAEAGVMLEILADEGVAT